MDTSHEGMEVGNPIATKKALANAIGSRTSSLHVFNAGIGFLIEIVSRFISKKLVIKPVHLPTYIVQNIRQKVL